jgi:hypothetical protein
LELVEPIIKAIDKNVFDKINEYVEKALSNMEKINRDKVYNELELINLPKWRYPFMYG